LIRVGVMTEDSLPRPSRPLALKPHPYTWPDSMACWVWLCEMMQRSKKTTYNHRWDRSGYR
jgi:hypothetical protein